MSITSNETQVKNKAVEARVGAIPYNLIEFVLSSAVDTAQSVFTLTPPSNDPVAPDRISRSIVTVLLNTIHGRLA